METLIDKAKKVVVKKTQPSKNTYNDEHLELVLAYLRGEILNKQMTTAAGAVPNGATAYVGAVLTWAIRNGKLKKV